MFETKEKIACDIETDIFNQTKAPFKIKVIKNAELKCDLRNVFDFRLKTKHYTNHTKMYKPVTTVVNCCWSCK